MTIMWCRRPLLFLAGFVGLAITSTAGAAAAATAPPPAALDFNRDVRPVLADSCFACHGPDERKRKGGLRLDLRAAATKPLESGATAIVPGKPADSELVKRITSADADEKMPPATSQKKLTKAQADLLTRWVAEGAKYAGHWA